MTNMSYVIFTALVMLLRITNLSVSYDIISTGYTALYSNMIPRQNVWLLVRIQSHLFPFQHSVANLQSPGKGGDDQFWMVFSPAT